MHHICQSPDSKHAEPDTGFEGFRSNLHFGLQKILYTPLNCTFSALYH